MVKNWVQTSLLLLLAVILTGIIFIIDVNTPSGLALGTMYCIVILYSWVLPGKFSSVYSALVCSVLVIVALVISNDTQTVDHISPANSIISLIVIWISASLMSIAKQSFDGLEEARDNLEEEVILRTHELKDSELNLQQMIEQVQDYAIYRLDNYGNITSWNIGAEKIIGYKPKDIIGQHISIIFTKEDLDIKKLEGLLKKAKSTGKSEDEGWRLKQSGGMFWAHVSISAIHDKFGLMKGFSVVTRDLTVRKKMEELLEATNNVARVGGWEVDLIQNTVNWTSVTKELHEVPTDFIPNLEDGINFFKEGESREMITNAVNEAIEKGTSYDVKLQIVTAKGNERWVRAIGQAEFVNKKCIRLYGTFQDIHENQLTHLRLEESELSLNQAQAISKIGSWQWNAKTNQVTWSDQMYEILGLNKDKEKDNIHIYKSLEFIHPDDKVRVKKYYDNTTSSDKRTPIECRIITDNNKVLKYIRSTRERILDVNGKLIRQFGTIQDITEQVQLKTQLNNFFENSLEMMCIANTKGYFLRLNSVWEKTLGYTIDELRSKPFIEFVHPDDRNPTANETTRQEKGGKTISFVNRYITKTGKVKWLEWSSEIDTDNDLFYAVARDITEKIESDRERKLYSEKLVAKNKELEQFAYITSHDLQEPLRTISSLTELLTKKYHPLLDSQGKQILQFITEASDRMRTLIKALLDFSRLGRSTELAEVDSNEIVKMVQEDLALAISECNATISIKNLPKINGYETELRVLFQNLISNALKFRAPERDPEIVVSAKKQKNIWVFSIKDNGIGIEPQFREKVFLIFQRLNIREKYEGTGIGLANCKKIVDAHRGKIWIDPKSTGGTTFCFSIPV